MDPGTLSAHSLTHNKSNTILILSHPVDLPKKQQYAAIFPDRGLSVRCVPESRSSSLKEIKKEAEARGVPRP